MMGLVRAATCEAGGLTCRGIFGVSFPVVGAFSNIVKEPVKVCWLWDVAWPGADPYISDGKHSFMLMRTNPLV